MDESFGKKEKLKSRVLIDKLFKEGRDIKKYPLLLLYLPLENSSEVNIKAGVSVSKRNFKKAVDRNEIKRLMREAFRKNKYLVTSNLKGRYVLMFIYTGRGKVPYQKLFSSIEDLLKKLEQQEKNDVK